MCVELLILLNITIVLYTGRLNTVISIAHKRSNFCLSVQYMKQEVIPALDYPLFKCTVNKKKFSKANDLPPKSNCQRQTSS